MYDYKSKVISLEKAYSLLEDRDQIISGTVGNDPKLFMGNLHTVLGKLKGIEVYNVNSPYNYDYLKPDYVDYITLNSWFFSGWQRAVQKQKNICHIPTHLRTAKRSLDKMERVKLFVSAASMPDDKGYMSMSLSAIIEPQAIEKAKYTILEINPNFPRTFGDVTVHVDQVDYLLEADYPAPSMPESIPSENDFAIGRHVKEYINDGDTLQIGIGGIPNALLKEIFDKKDLGVHSELLTTGIMELMKAGVINNQRKSINRGKTISTFVFGSQELYDYIDNNPAICVMDGRYVNNPSIVAQNDNMVAINTTIEVDLVGQCFSESIGNMQVSGTGGQVEMATGALMAKNGRSFMCLHSTSSVKDRKTGERVEVSNIVPFGKPAGVVTLPRTDVDCIVTEYGVADIKGLSVQHRAQELIKIAHPKFKDELKQAAKELYHAF